LVNSYAKGNFRFKGKNFLFDDFFLSAKNSFVIVTRQSNISVANLAFGLKIAALSTFNSKPRSGPTAPIGLPTGAGFASQLDGLFFLSACVS